MDWAATSQNVFLRKIEKAAEASGQPLTERERELLCHGVLEVEDAEPPEPGFRKRMVLLLEAAYQADLKAYEESTRVWKQLGYPKAVWLRNLRHWHPRPANELRAIVEFWALKRFGELRIQDHELFGGM
ncbi:MAG: hypothetical protein RX316_08165 [bacterium]|nr:hypothetical protein [bacterium]